jgi:DNA-binding response OmpR family regulator
LVVEDDDAIAEPLCTGLIAAGHEVTRLADGQGALAAPEHDLVLLDLGLPDLDGFEVCRRLRAESNVPIIVISARGEEVDRVIGLELGADDYIVKPFGFRELLARVRAVTRRTSGQVGSLTREATTLGDVVIDHRTHRVTVAGDEVELAPKEFALLELLAEDPGALRSRDDILHEVWDAHWWGPTKTLDVHIASLRRKLGRPALIETVRGVGYRLSVADGAP